MDEFVLDFTDERNVRVLFFGHRATVTISTGHATEEEIPEERVVSLDVKRTRELAEALLKWSTARGQA